MAVGEIVVCAHCGRSCDSDGWIYSMHHQERLCTECWQKAEGPPICAHCGHQARWPQQYIDCVEHNLPICPVCWRQEEGEK